MINVKRISDIIFAVFGLIILSIPMIFIGILIRIKMGSPVFFTQERAGKHGEPFTIYKFRSMTNERDEDGELLPEEERITPLGRFLRRSTLDELPELINVLKNDMSIVGPRPLHVQYVDIYSDFQYKRLNTKPGLTGWAVINGRNALSWEERFEYDVYYVENQSIWFDMKIIVQTILLIFKREGISHENDATMHAFTGKDSDD